MPKRVLVQAGHIAPRESFLESGTGTVREQELTFALRKRLVSLLNVDPRFDAFPFPGNLPEPPGFRCDAAIFLHGDGSSNRSASGYSFGFPVDPVNQKLARLIDAEFKKIPGHPPHHADNYTEGLRFYYGYRRTNTAGPEVLVEHGFMTNPAEQKWVFAHLNQLAHAEYVALCRFFGFAPRGEIVPARVGWTVTWTDKAGVVHSKRTFAPRRLFLRLWADGIRRKILVRRNLPLQPM
jgi:N-acetylmuramoyl-L-alanine amidase-like protein